MTRSKSMLFIRGTSSEDSVLISEFPWRERPIMALEPDARLGPYEVLGPLGAGGMGEVYRARDPRIGREVALKVLPAAVSQNRDHLARFEQEARATGALNHPNLLVIFDFGTHDGAPFIVSELLEGATLRDRLSE